LATLQRLGIERELPVVPSVFLGAGAVSPLEMAVMYQTIAAQGVSAGLRSIRTITDVEGTPLARFPQKPIQAVSPAAIHVLHYAMQEVMQEGTGRAAKNVLPTICASPGSPVSRAIISRWCGWGATTINPPVLPAPPAH
jgi:penicillin-binding protein 1B